MVRIKQHNGWLRAIALIFLPQRREKFPAEVEMKTIECKATHAEAPEEQKTGFRKP
jgi:hypothetical protein